MSYKITDKLKTVVKLALEHGRRNRDIIFKQLLGAPKARILGETHTPPRHPPKCG